MRKMMQEKEEAWRAVAEWRDATTGDLVHQLIVGPYSRKGTANGSLTQEINLYWGPGRKYEQRVKDGELTFDRWAERSATQWVRV